MGHVITLTGIEVDPSPIITVRNFPRPRNIKELRSFLGLVNYDRRFINQFSELVKELAHVLKKGSRFLLTDKEQNVFEGVKEAFSDVICLRHPDMTLPFYINSDVSAFTIGASLYQINRENQRHVVAYYSRSLKGPERNYMVTEKEALAILDTQWRVFVLGRQFIVSTDYKALAFLKLMDFIYSGI